jgi:hypothetical protein
MMEITCGSENRRSMVKNHHKINGIDHIDVVIIEDPANTIPNPLVIVHCFKSAESLDGGNVIFEGGVRVRGIKPEWGYAASNFVGLRGSLPNRLVSDKELELIRKIENGQNVLVVRANNHGDFSLYEMRIVKRPDQEQDTFNFDHILSRARFSFKVECQKFDCTCGKPVPPDLEEPAIDYLAKDYASFRKLVLNRLSLLIPDWKERNASDQGIMLAELMAYVGDHLS